MRETPCRVRRGVAKSLGRDSAMLGCHSRLLFPIRAIRAIRGQVNHRKSGTWWNRSLPNPSSPLAPKTSWDETSQPLPAASITSGLETSRLQTSRAFATQNFLGRDVPAPIQTLNDFGVGDVPSPHLPRPRNPELPGTRRPSPHPDPQLLRGRRRDVSTRDNTKRRNGGALQADGLDSSAGKDPQRHKGHCAPCQQGLGSLSRNVGTSSRSPGKFPPIEGIEERE